MCAKCTQARTDAFDEIRDLLNFKRPTKGELSQRIFDAVEECRADGNEITESEIDSLRAEMILARAAYILSKCPKTEFHGAPPSFILANCAQRAMSAEGPLGGLLSALLGSGQARIVSLSELLGMEEEDTDDDD